MNVDGVHAGNLGGGIALARGYFVTDKDNGTVTAASNVDTVTMNFKGGYNVATAAGGLAVAHDKADASKAANQTNANANVDEVLRLRFATVGLLSRPLPMSDPLPFWSVVVALTDFPVAAALLTT